MVEAEEHREAGSMSESPIAKRLSDASVVMEGTPHPELVDMLRIGANEVQRLWELAEKRYYANQRLEARIEELEEALLELQGETNPGYPKSYALIHGTNGLLK
ncbi:unnamed protein product [Sphagnum balticum]